MLSASATGALALLLITASPSPASALWEDDAYRLATLTFHLPAGDSVGPKRAGSLCLPAGRVTLREARPGSDEAREAVVRALGEGGLAVRPADMAAVDDDTPARFRVTGEVAALRLSACVPPGGLGRLINHSHTIKGDGRIAVRWTVTDQTSRAVTKRVSCVGFTYRGEGALADMTLAGLTTAARDLVAGLKGGAAASVTAPDEFCQLAGAS